MNQRRGLLRVAGLLAGIMVICSVGGCSYEDTFIISGVVRDAENGAPLAGVEISFLDEWGDDAYGRPIVTNRLGKFAFTYRVRPSASDTIGHLKLAKQSYASDEIEIAVDVTKLSPKVPTYIEVITYLRRQKAPDAAAIGAAE